MHDHPHQHLIHQRTQRIGTFPASLEGYQTCHLWLIMAHISLGHLEHHWKTFNRQMDRTHQLLQFLGQ